MRWYRLDRRGWIPKLLKLGIALELADVFSLVITEGVLQLWPFSDDRFTSYYGHATACWLLFAALEVYNTRASEERARRFSVAKLFLLALCFIGAGLYFRYGLRLSADGPHYFVQARSVLFDGDLDFENDYARIRAPKPIAERYPIGMALLSLPFLGITHVLLLVGNALGHAWETDGFGYPYQTAFGLTGYVLGSLGLFHVLRTTVRYFSVGLATSALVTVWASSFLVWHMVSEPSMPHAASFAFTAFFLCFWIDKRPMSLRRDWIGLGMLAGIATLVRWQNAVLLVLPTLDRALDSPRTAVKSLWAWAAMAVCLIPQLLFWRVTSGSALSIPFAGHGFHWDQLRVLEVLFSTNRGLFTWNPVFYLGLLGLLVWWKDAKRLASLFLLGFFLEVVINADVAIWWAGWSFGGRRFDSCVLFFVIGTAACFQFLKQRPWLPVLGLSVVLISWGYGVMIQTRRGVIPPDRLVSFHEVTAHNVRYFYERFGFPFASPLNWVFAGKYGVSPEKFDLLFGHEGFGNMHLVFSTDSEPYVGRGWGGPEVDPEGRWFRWSVGPESTFFLPLREARDYDLYAQVRPYSGAFPNRIGLRINGRPQRSQSVSGETILRWRILSRAWRPGINVLRFDFARTASPEDDGIPGDPRELGFAFYRLELIAVPREE